MFCCSTSVRCLYLEVLAKLNEVYWCEIEQDQDVIHPRWCKMTKNQSASNYIQFKLIFLNKDVLHTSLKYISMQHFLVFVLSSCEYHVFAIAYGHYRAERNAKNAVSMIKKNQCTWQWLCSFYAKCVYNKINFEIAIPVPICACGMFDVLVSRWFSFQISICIICHGDMILEFHCSITL